MKYSPPIFVHGCFVALMMYPIIARVACTADSAESQTLVGFRGNWTGNFRDCTPPLEWHRWVKSPVHDLRVLADKPRGESDGDAIGSSDGYIWQFLVLGPIQVADAATALDQSLIGDEGNLEPREGDKAAIKGGNEGTWKKYYFGPGVNGVNYENPCLKIYGGTNTRVAYVMAYVHSSEDQQVPVGISNQGGDKKLLVNGERVVPPAAGTKTPTMAPLRKGWNRLLLKCVNTSENGKEWAVKLWFPRSGKLEYETKNVQWMTKISTPGKIQANASTPIVVGDKIFITAEPTDLICINRADGKILWIRSNDLYQVASDEEKADPSFKSRFEARAAKLQELNEAYIKAFNAVDNAEIQRGIASAKSDALNQLLEQKYKIAEELFANMVGLNKVYAIQHQTNGCCNHTPISDGKHVWVEFAYGMLACYDLDGAPVWKQYFKGMNWPHHGNHISPAMAHGKIVFMCGPNQNDVYASMVCIDAATGKELWRTGKVKFRDATFLITSIGGEDVITTWDGAGYRLSDGHGLWIGIPWEGRGGVGSTTPVIDKGFWYFHDSDRLTVAKLPDTADGKLKVLFRIPYNNISFPISSPVVLDDLVFGMTNSGRLQIWDAKEGKLVDDRQLNLRPRDSSRVTVGACASLALANNKVYLLDNTGVAMVLEPTREAKQVARNVLEHHIPTFTPGEVQPEQTVAWTFGGKNIFIRGTEYLYCIGEK